MMVARADALSTATNQGVAAGSVVGGAYGNISGNANVASQGVTQNQLLGQDIFAANQQYAQAGSQAALGSAISQVGGMVTNNSQQIGQVGSYLFG